MFQTYKVQMKKIHNFIKALLLGAKKHQYIDSYLGIQAMDRNYIDNNCTDVGLGLTKKNLENLAPLQVLWEDM